MKLDIFFVSRQKEPQKKSKNKQTFAINKKSFTFATLLEIRKTEI